jgi:hypothetical protein
MQSNKDIALDELEREATEAAANEEADHAELLFQIWSE